MATAAETIAKLGVGLLVWWSGRFRHLIVAGGCLYLVGELLQIAAQRIGHSIPLLITAETLLAISRSSFDGVKEIALLHSAHLGDTAILLAMLSVCNKLGGMIGATIADGVWAEALPNAPKNYLSGEAILSAREFTRFLKNTLLSPLGVPRGWPCRSFTMTRNYTLLSLAAWPWCLLFPAHSSWRMSISSPPRQSQPSRYEPIGGDCGTHDIASADP